MSAPAGSFPPGTTILIVNSGNGVVLSLTADNAGAVSGELPASVAAQWELGERRRGRDAVS